MPDVFFLVEERSEVGQRLDRAAPAYFLGVKLMFVDVVNFGQVDVGVKNFLSCSNPNFRHLHRSC